ncbi:hypothetical protein [uncultured Microbacterium sp.]|uniref:hypothetical protein n=1 Tax=uncultured Microbacterium sp. TaxID=191216 RepID=UPI0025FEBD9D|nr:hypothetical protein [uncultured Microbacterium sp.]
MPDVAQITLRRFSVEDREFDRASESSVRSSNAQITVEVDEPEVPYGRRLVDIGFKGYVDDEEDPTWSFDYLVKFDVSENENCSDEVLAHLAAQAVYPYVRIGIMHAVSLMQRGPVIPPAGIPISLQVK